MHQDCERLIASRPETGLRGGNLKEEDSYLNAKNEKNRYLKSDSELRNDQPL